MKAALWYGQKDVRVEEVEMPVAKKGEVLIKVKWCGICGTDLHEYLAGPIFIPAETHPTTGVKAPVILGHEFSGEVVELGEGVSHLAVGDPVVVEPLITCGECEYCKKGEYQLCDKIAFHGLQNTGGGFAEYTAFRADKVKKLPEGVSYEMGALVEPMAVALHALEMGEFKAKQTAVVVGAGPIGLGVIENLKATGAKTVIAVELSEARKEKAKIAGADYVFDPREVDVVAEVKKLTNGLGADISFEVTSVQPGLDTAMAVIKKQGTCVVVAIWEHEAKMNLFDVVMSEKKVVGIVCYNDGTFETVAQYMADGRIKATGYATTKIHLDDLVEKGFGALLGPDRESEVKVLVTPEKGLL